MYKWCLLYVLLDVFVTFSGTFAQRVDRSPNFAFNRSESVDAIGDERGSVTPRVGPPEEEQA